MSGLHCLAHLYGTHQNLQDALHTLKTACRIILSEQQPLVCSCFAQNPTRNLRSCNATLTTKLAMSIMRALSWLFEQCRQSLNMQYGRYAGALFRVKGCICFCRLLVLSQSLDAHSEQRSYCRKDAYDR